MGSTLLEADPSANYERAVMDFAREMTSAGRAVFVLTSRGSPVHLLLRGMERLTFFILSDVSYPKPSGNPGEVMVPHNDPSVLLNVIDDAITKDPEARKALVFDNISSMILDAGFEDTYKFLKQMNEILGRGDAVSLSIALSKAHDENAFSLIRNLYSSHQTYDSVGLRLTKPG